MGRQYQTFDDAKGHSDSAAKLAGLRLPENFRGKSLLDIACNEGFFCQEAWRRGAGRVVGIDKHGGFVERARRRDPRTEYHVMDWTRLPELDETFDIVLLLSALHYAEDPSAVLQLALDRVQPEGMLVLECGVAPGSKPEWVTVTRPRGDVVRHGTRSMMLSAVPGAVVRMLGGSVEQPGDPIPRGVFRFTRRKPTIMLIEGRPGSGKSTLTRTLRGEDHAAIGLDHLLATLPQWCSEPSLVALAQETEGRLGEMGPRLAQAGLEETFVDAVLERRDALAAALTVIEGHTMGFGAVAEVFARRLTEAGAFVWHVQPSDLRPRLFGGVRQAR